LFDSCSGQLLRGSCGGSVLTDLESLVAGFVEEVAL